MPKAVVFVEGGLVQGVIADQKIEILIVDYDIEGADAGELTEVPQSDGKTTLAYAHEESVLVSTDKVEQFFEAFNKESN